MKWIFGRSSGAARHPLLEAHKRLGRRRATGADLEAFSRRLLDTPLHLATHRSAERLDETDVMVLDLASDDATALPAYLDAPEALVTLGQIGGWASVSGSDVCRIARARTCHELAVFADPKRDPVVVVPWGVIDWLGAGLMPYYLRNVGDHAILHDPALVDACRAAVELIDEVTMAQLTEGVHMSGESRALIQATVADSISPRTWFAVRDRIETDLREAGHVVTVVTEPPEAVILETYQTFDEWSAADESTVFIKPVD
jgi:hypothetical protein